MMEFLYTNFVGKLWIIQLARFGELALTAVDSFAVVNVSTSCQSQFEMGCRPCRNPGCTDHLPDQAAHTGWGQSGAVIQRHALPSPRRCSVSPGSPCTRMNNVRGDVIYS